MSALNRGLPKFIAVAGIACAILAFALPLVAFVAPQSGSQTLGLLVVQPSLANINARPGTPPPDGPSFFLGPLASCSKASNDGDMNCTGQSISPIYDTSNLPDDSLTVVLSPPSPAIAGIMATSLAITGLFFILYTLVIVRQVYGKGPEACNGPGIQMACRYVGSIGFVSGSVTFIIMLMWFSKTVTDINNFISSQGSQGPRLAAELGHSWFFVIGGYSAFLVPCAVAIMEMNKAMPGKVGQV
jgi:hypothetical protein